MDTPNLVKIYESNPNFVNELAQFNMLTGGFFQSPANQTLLHKALQKRDLNFVDKILNIYASDNYFDNKTRAVILNMRDENGDTPAHIATREGFIPIVKRLKELGADFNIKNKKNEIIVETPDASPNASPSYPNTRTFGGNNAIGMEFSTTSSEMPLMTQKVGGHSKDALDFVNSLSYSAKENFSPIKYDSPAFHSPPFLDIISSESVNNIMMKPMNGGGYANNYNNDFTTEVDGPSTLSEISSTNLSPIKEDINDIFIGDGNNYKFQHGGANVVRGSRRIFVDRHSDTPVNSEGGAKIKESSRYHEEAIKIIQDMGYSLDDAKAIKARLWTMIKEKYTSPDYSNLDKSKKLREIAEDKDLLKSIDPEQVRQMIHNNKNESKQNTKKDSKKTAKKASKKASKKTSKKASK